MENKNKRFYLPMALLAVAVVAGVSFSSLRNSGSANLIAQTSTGGGSGSSTTYNCDELRVKLNSSTGYTSAEKSWYNQNCTTSTTSTGTSSGSDSSTSSGTGSGSDSTTSSGTGGGSDSTTSSGTGGGSGTMAPPSTTGTDNGSGSSTSDTTKTTTPSTTTAPSTTPTTTPTYTCEGAYKDLNTTTGNYTYDEKVWYSQYCGPTPSTLPVTPAVPTTLQPTDPCATLKDIMAKYSYDTTSSAYLSAQWKFNEVCSTPTTTVNPSPTSTSPATTTPSVCSDLKMKLGTSIDNNDTSSDTYAKLKLSYQDLCTESTPTTDVCSSLKLKLETAIADGVTSSDYASVKEQYLKSCTKPVPPAGFEDKVMTTTTDTTTPFIDAPTATLEGTAAAELYRRGVIGGFSDSTYRGKNLVNRAEAAKFLLLARYGTVADVSAAGSVTFRDTPKGAWFEKYIGAASSLGIIKGYSDGTFKPANGVNTAEFLKMMTLALGLETNLPYTYSDVQSTDWFAIYAGSASKYNLFPDRTGGTLQPARLLTRNEVAVAIYQFLLNRDNGTTPGTTTPPGRG